MALIGLSITKRMAFRDSTQDFSNVYHYTYTGLNPSAGFAEQILDTIVNLEKSYHATVVSFVYGRVWSAGGSVSDNQMIFQKALTGAGSATADASVDRERATLFSWPAGYDSLGRPVFLRKWYHTISASPFGVAPSQGNMQNISSYSSGSRTTMATAANNFTSPVVNAQSISLCGPTGRATTGGPIAHKFYEHHQLGDMWR
jgi:hypothetical protein